MTSDDKKRPPADEARSTEDTKAILSRRQFLIKSALVGVGVAVGTAACGDGDATDDTAQPCLSIDILERDVITDQPQVCLKVAPTDTKEDQPQPCLAPLQPDTEGDQPQVCLKVAIDVQESDA